MVSIQASFIGSNKACSNQSIEKHRQHIIILGLSLLCIVGHYAYSRHLAGWQTEMPLLLTAAMQQQHLKQEEQQQGSDIIPPSATPTPNSDAASKPKFISPSTFAPASGRIQQAPLQMLDIARLPIHRSSHKLPEWMVDYFAWHEDVRAHLTAETWQDHKYLVMRCLRQDTICGGTSDRLQPLPFMLLMAHLTQRILLIYWEQPFPLETFLLPPKGGLDWRVPSFLDDKMPPHTSVPLTFAPRAIKQLTSSLQNTTIVYTRDQTHNHGKSVYDEYHQIHNWTSRFDSVFSDAWRMVFTPSPAVTDRMVTWMYQQSHSQHSMTRRSNLLVPGQYVGAHCRALYGVQNRSMSDIAKWAENAIRCATTLQPSLPIFFASDSTDAQNVALKYGRVHNVTVISRFHDQEPLHLEKANSTGKTERDYYDIFVDLYLLGNSRGMAYNVGGYGRLGLIMGFDADKGLQYQKGGVPWKGGMTSVKLHQCDLKRPYTTTASPPPPSDSSVLTMEQMNAYYFAPPMAT